METMDKILIGASFVLVLAAVFLTLNAQPPEVPEPEPDVSATRELFLKAVSIGKGQDNYYYAYTEAFNDFDSTYRLLRKYDESMLEIETVFSTKQIYFLENDTILCVDYMGYSECSSVRDETELESYLDGLEGLFFDDWMIDQTVADTEYFELYGFIRFSPEIETMKLNGRECLGITYNFDFTNMSVYEASKFGIGPATPRQFLYEMCVVNETGEIIRKHITYSQAGVLHENTFNLIESEWDTSRTFEPPENLTDGALDLLVEENSKQNILSECYAEEGDERDRCISMFALNLKSRDLCELAGGRRDRCLVSIVPFVRDESICMDIMDMSYKDDCYIEMGGATGNDSYCAHIANQSKADFCMNISAEGGVPLDAPEPVDDDEFVHDYSDIDAFVLDLYMNSTNSTRDENDTNVTEP